MATFHSLARVTTALVTHLRRHVVGYLALALVLGMAPAYAAGTMVGSAQIKKNAIASRHIAKGQVKNSELRTGAVTATKVRRDSLTGAQIKESTLRLPRVREFRSAPATVYGGYEVSLPGLTEAEIARSTFVVHYTTAWDDADTWYPAPGLGPDALFATRWRVGRQGGAYVLDLRLHNPHTSGTYPGEVPFTALRVTVTTLPLT